MTLTPEELEQLLRLSLAALRAQAPSGVQAVEVAPALAAQVEAQAPAPAAPAGRTLGDWLTVYEQVLAQRGYKAQTVKNYSATLKHVSRLWGEQPIDGLKPHRIAADLRSFLPEHSSSACRVLAAVRDIYTEAIANGWTESNPAAFLKPPAHKVQRERLRFETWCAMLELAKVSPQQWLECLLLLSLVTAQRRADLAKMKFDDIVTDEAGEAVLRVEQQKEAGKGFGARVEIPLSLRLDAIGMTLGDVIERCRAAGKPGPNLLRKAGGGAIEMSSLSARFAECIHAVLGKDDPGAHKRPSLHEARSLSGRLYDAQGVNVQTLLGHKHPEMTALYLDDRGLSAHVWKRVQTQPPVPKDLH